MSIPNEKQIKKIFRQCGADFAYLFGSRALKQNTRTSDFDFAVYLNTASAGKRFKIRLELLKKLSPLFAPVPVDVVVLNDAHSVTLRYAIITEGKLIYEKNPAMRLNFEFFTMKEYEDFSPFLKAYNQVYLSTSV